MDKYKYGMRSKAQWIAPTPTVIDYGHQRAQGKPEWNPDKKALPQAQSYLPVDKQPTNKSSFGMWNPVTVTQDKEPFKKLYDPFEKTEDMDISDDEKQTQTPKNISSNMVQYNKTKVNPSLYVTMKITSGAAFYKGLILYIPPFQQISNTYRVPPAMKMLHASFEFSMKSPIKIEIKPKPNTPSMSEASIFFQEHLIVKTTSNSLAAQNEVSVKALELLSETCYTIQAKDEYFLKCKVIDAGAMKTLNLKKWEEVSGKHPKILEVTKDSHIQKTFAVFLDGHTSKAVQEDIICWNLTRQDVDRIKRVVEFYGLTMLPCGITANMNKKDTPYAVSIQKYTSAAQLLEHLVKCGGESEEFRIFPPDTFKDFYKLHQNYWDSALQRIDPKNILKSKTTLEDEELQSAVLKPYENIVTKLFEKHKSLPSKKKENKDTEVRMTADNFMKETFKIDMADSKNIAPVERMQLLLKYMEQLQEYGNRVLTSGRTEMIKIYHNAIDNLRKDLETCRQDIEKVQKEKVSETEMKKLQSRWASPQSRRKTPPKIHTKSPSRRFQEETRKRSVSPRRRQRSPRRPVKRRSASPRKRRSLSPKRRPRSKSPKARLERIRDSLPSRKRSPIRRSSPTRRSSPVRRPRSRSPQISQYPEIKSLRTIFEEKFRNYVERLRHFRIEIEDTPLDKRFNLIDMMIKFQESLRNFYSQASENSRELGEFLDEIAICQEELDVQVQMITGPSNSQRSQTSQLNQPSQPSQPPPPLWINERSFDKPHSSPWQEPALPRVVQANTQNFLSGFGFR